MADEAAVHDHNEEMEIEVGPDVGGIEMEGLERQPNLVEGNQGVDLTQGVGGNSSYTGPLTRQRINGAALAQQALQATRKAQEQSSKGGADRAKANNGSSIKGKSAPLIVAHSQEVEKSSHLSESEGSGYDSRGSRSSDRGGFRGHGYRGRGGYLKGQDGSRGRSPSYYDNDRRIYGGARSRSPVRGGRNSGPAWAGSSMIEGEGSKDYGRLQEKVVALEKQLATERAATSSATEQLLAVREENKKLLKDNSFFRNQYNAKVGASYVIGMGPVSSSAGDSSCGTADLLSVPGTEEMRAIYTRLQFPIYGLLISKSYMEALMLNASLPEQKVAQRMLASVNETSAEPWLPVRLPIMILRRSTNSHAAKDSMTLSGTADVLAFIVPDAEFAMAGASDFSVLCGNLQEVLNQVDRRDTRLFRPGRYDWYLDYSVDADVPAKWGSTMPLTLEMLNASANKPSSLYPIAGSQREAGVRGNWGARAPKISWSQSLGRGVDSTRYTQQRSHTGMASLSVEEGEGSSDEEVYVLKKGILTLLNPTTQQKSKQKGGSQMVSSAWPGMGQGRKTKEGFYDTSNESLEEVCVSSKWAKAGPFMKDVNVTYGAEVFSLEVAISVAMEEKIPLVMADAPLRLRGGGERGEQKFHNVPSTISNKPWPADCNFALLADVVKNIAAEVIPGYRVGQNLNHEEGKVLYMTLMKFGFQKKPDGSDSPAKRWLLDLNVNASDPLALNFAMAAVIARYHTEEHQALTLRNFQAGKQGDESLETYFDTMLASAKGAEATMSFKEQANTIRAGMRDGTMVKAQLLGKAIPKMASWEELVTLVKHTWLPEAINYREDGPVMLKGDKKQTGPGAASQAKKKSAGEGKVTDDNPSSTRPWTEKWCNHCKASTHNTSTCYAVRSASRRVEKPATSDSAASQGVAATNTTATGNAGSTADTSKNVTDKRQSDASKDGRKDSTGKGSAPPKPGGQ